jgi:hypothetical protein
MRNALAVMSTASGGDRERKHVGLEATDGFEDVDPLSHD